MILLDTNVISALMLRQPPEAVIVWLDGHPSEDIWTTSVSIFEIRFGLALLDAGARRQALEAAFLTLVDRYLAERAVVFDRSAAEAAAEVAAAQQRRGRPMQAHDAQIAGIAVARRASIATRNVRRFQGLGLPILNPWDEA